MKKMFTLILLFLPIILYAPSMKYLNIPLRSEIKPFERLSWAVTIVESSGNNNALNEKEMAFGAFQIRQCLLSDFNRLSGKDYKLPEMYEYEKAKEVFIFFACMYMDLEIISKKWNGSGEQTEVYWQKIKVLL